MKKFFLSQRSKWLIAIGLIAVAAGLTAKTVISYPEECNPEIPLKTLSIKVDGIS